MSHLSESYYKARKYKLSYEERYKKDSGFMNPAQRGELVGAVRNAVAIIGESAGVMEDKDGNKVKYITIKVVGI